MDVVAKTLAWNGSPTTQGRAELALPLPEPPRLTEDEQFIRVKAMAVYKGEPGWAVGHQPCGLRKHGLRDRDPN